MQPVALVVGVTGLVGGNAARELLAGGWQVFGMSRNPAKDMMAPGAVPVAANLQDGGSVKKALADVAPTHVFFTTWSRQATEAENIAVNGAMVRNVLDALSPKKCVYHVDLVTGLKHYLGPFEAYKRGDFRLVTPLREEQGRLDLPNFYYAQEDEVFAAAKRDHFTWTVQRPHTIIGRAIGNAMNMGSTLAVYASICKETGRKFRWPGTQSQWNGLVDVTDARVLAKHLVWAANSVKARNEAFNVVNGDTFRWNWLWPRIAQWFGVEWAGFEDRVHTLETEMADAPPIWAKMVKKYGLAEADFDRVATPWFVDLDLGRPIEVMTDMTKSRLAGFMEFQSTEHSFTDLFTQMRQTKLIP